VYTLQWRRVTVYIQHCRWRSVTVPRVTVPVQDGAGVPNLPTAVALALGNEDPPPLRLSTVLAQPALNPKRPFRQGQGFPGRSHLNRCHLNRCHLQR